MAKNEVKDFKIAADSVANTDQLIALLIYL